MGENMRDMTLNLIVNSQVDRVKDFNKELKKTQNGIENTQNKVGWLSKSLRRLFGAYALFAGAKGFIKTYRQIDLVQRSLSALTGGVAEGAKHFEFLKNAAFQTGTGIMEVAKAYRGYYYAAKTAGLSNEELQNSFMGVMVGARVLGANKVQVSGAMLALEQMLNKTTVQAEEMNRQLGNAISGAREMAAEAMGMSVAEFTQKMQKKQIKSAEFVKKFGDYMYKQFKEKLPEAMKSLDAQVVNLSNAWILLQKELGDMGIGRELVRIVAALMRLIQSPKLLWTVRTLGAGFASILKLVGDCIDQIKMIVFLLGPVVLGGLVDKLIKGVIALVMWIRAGNLALSTTQKFFVGLTIAFLFIEDFIYFLMGKKSLLQLALTGDESMSTMERIVTQLIEIGGALGTIYFFVWSLSKFKGVLTNLFGKKLPKLNAGEGGIAETAKGGVSVGGGGAGIGIAGKQAAETSKILKSSGQPFTRAEIDLMKKNAAKDAFKNAKYIKSASRVGLKGLPYLGEGLIIYDVLDQAYTKSGGIDYKRLGAPVPGVGFAGYVPELTKTETYAPNITYSPQTKIDVHGNSPQEILAQIKGFLDERDRNFWTKITNPATNLIPSFAGGQRN